MARSERKNFRPDAAYPASGVWSHVTSSRYEGRPIPARDLIASLQGHVWIFAAGAILTLFAAGLVYFQMRPNTTAMAEIIGVSANADPATLLSSVNLARAVDDAGIARLFPAWVRDDEAPDQIMRTAAADTLRRELRLVRDVQGGRSVLVFVHRSPAVAAKVIGALVENLPTPAQVAALPAPPAHLQRIANLRQRLADVGGEQSALDAAAENASTRLSALAGELAVALQPPAEDPDLAAARSQLNDLKLHRVLLAGKYADGSDVLQAADQQIDQMTALVKQEAASHPAPPDPTAPLVQEQTRLRGELATIAAQKQAQLALAASITASIASEAAAADRDAAAVNRPSLMCRSVSVRRDRDDRWLTVPATLLAGLLMSAAATLWAFARRKSLQTVLEVETCLGLPVMVFDHRLSIGQDRLLLPQADRADATAPDLLTLRQPRF